MRDYRDLVIESLSSETLQLEADLTDALVESLAYREMVSILLAKLQVEQQQRQRTTVRLKQLTGLASWTPENDEGV